MKHALIFLVGLCLLLCTTPATAQGDAPAADERQPLPHQLQQPFLLGGIQTHELDHQRWMAALHQSGMNAVQVTVYAHQGPWNTAKLWYQEEEPAVLNEIRAAHENGLQVVLVLRIALDHNEPANRHLWHGLIYPETEQATLDWFRIYTDFVVKWGRIAEQEGIEVLGVASEMNSLVATLPVGEIPDLAQYYLDDESQTRLRTLVGRSEHLFSEDVRVGMGAGDFTSLDDFLVQRNQAERTWAKVFVFKDTDGGSEAQIALMNQRRKLLDAHWRGLVKQVRQVYSGRLTLAANFDNYHEVGFWDDLDFMGINAYFPLRKTLETPLSEAGLAGSWREVFNKINTFKQTYDLTQDVIFTELGYTRWRGVTVAPWSSQGFIPMWDPDGETEKDRAFFWSAQPIEPKERALALRALHRVWSEGETGLSGVLYWKLSSVFDLQRFEPFMLHLGEQPGDPLYDELTRFAENIRPLSPFTIGDDPYLQGVDAIVQNDLESLGELETRTIAAQSEGRAPALHLATRLGRRAMVHHLLASGASVEQQDTGGFLPIHWTCYQDDPAMVELLAPQTTPQTAQNTRPPSFDNRDETPLMKCARLDNEAVARRLLEADPRQVSARNENGRSALHLAADQASPGVIEALVAAGADAHQSDLHGQTPLHLSARRGDVAGVRILAKETKGKANGDGNRPVHEAAIYGRHEVFQLLFEEPIAKEINVYGQSILHLAAHGGDLEILRTLLPHFPKVDRQDSDGWTPLAFATRNEQLEAVELLLENGASIEHRNQEGLSPLHLAAASHDPRLIQKFVRQEINLNLADSKGNTALHHSAGWGHVENIRLLLDAGANPDHQNNEGDTPLDLAERFDKHRAALLLRTTQPISRVQEPATESASG